MDDDFPRPAPPAPPPAGAAAVAATTVATATAAVPVAPPLEYTPPADAAPPSSPFTIEVIKGGTVVEVLPLPTTASFATVGRLPLCDVPLEHQVCKPLGTSPHTHTHTHTHTLCATHPAACARPDGVAVPRGRSVSRGRYGGLVVHVSACMHAGVGLREVARGHRTGDAVRPGQPAWDQAEQAGRAATDTRAMAGGLAGELWREHAAAGAAWDGERGRGPRRRRHRRPSAGGQARRRLDCRAPAAQGRGGGCRRRGRGPGRRRPRRGARWHHLVCLFPPPPGADGRPTTVGLTVGTRYRGMVEDAVDEDVDGGGATAGRPGAVVGDRHPDRDENGERTCSSRPPRRHGPA
jgi:hypothetical protein